MQVIKVKVAVTFEVEVRGPRGLGDAIEQAVDLIGDQPNTSVKVLSARAERTL